MLVSGYHDLFSLSCFQAKCSSDSVPVNHGDIVQVGCTRFLLHIHSGSETCDDCEPGIVQAAFQAQQAKGEAYADLQHEDQCRVSDTSYK